MRHQLIPALILIFAASTFSACTDECPSGRETVELEATALGIHFFIDKYEASRPDATGSSEGSSGDQACSVPGALPWTKASFGTAKDACDAAGMRLCTADEWRDACRGLGADRKYAYAQTSYQAGVCNDSQTGGSTAPTGSKSGCETQHNIFDMSGNVREWTSGKTLHGGAFGSPAIDVELTCTTPTTTAGGGSGDGFRCCKSP